jgi:hypothetical protein
MHIRIIAYFTNSVTDSSKHFLSPSSFKEVNSLVITAFLQKYMIHRGHYFFYKEHWLV